MATLNIRNLPDEVHARLWICAAKTGRSMEAEARRILIEACWQEDKPPLTAEALQAWVDQLYGGNKPVNVVDQLIQERRAEAEREALQ